MLVDRRGLSSCLQKKTSTHCLDCLLPCPFMRTMSKLPTLQEKDKRWNVRGLLKRTLNILLFIGIDVKLNQGNKCLWPITPLLIGDPMVCAYLSAQMILIVLCVIMLLKQHGRLPTVQWNTSMTKDSLAGLMAKWHLLALKSSSINELGLNNGTSENLLQVLKNLELGLDISQRPVVVIVIIPSVIIIYFIQACVPLLFVMAIRNLQFNRFYVL